MAATDQYQIIAQIEGLDVADLGFGAGSARPISVGFWFRSSITGTFSGAVRNGAFTRAYVFSWNYAATNVWQFVPIQNIPGDTTGVWAVGAAQAMSVTFSLGAGTNFTGTSGVWAAGTAHHAPGAANLIATSGATMDIALLQVEAGPVCTPYEWVPHPVALARVQRYFETGDFFVISTVTPSTAPFDFRGFCGFRTTKRAVPTAITGTAVTSGAVSPTVTAHQSGFLLFTTTTASGQCSVTYTNWTAAAEL
jgi:hypothetical protein